MQPQQPGSPQTQGPVPGWQAPNASPPGGSQWPESAGIGLPPPPGRPVLVTAAAIVLLVLGVLTSLLGLLFLIVGAMFGTIIAMPEFQDQFGTVSAAAGGVFVVFGALFLADGLLQVIAGIFTFPGRGWARIAGLIAGIIGALIALIGVLPAQGGGGGFNLFFVVVLAGYGYTVWVLATSGDWFRR